MSKGKEKKLQELPPPLRKEILKVSHRGNLYVPDSKKNKHELNNVVNKKEG